MVIALSLVERIGLHQAGIHCKAFTTNQTFGHATLQDCLEQLSKHITFLESPMPVLGESGMIRYLDFQAQATV